MQNSSSAGTNFSGNSGNKENTNPNLHAQGDHSSKTGGDSKIAREFNNFVADIEDLIKATTNLTGEDLQKAKDKLNERISAAKKSVTEVSETVVERARKTAETTNTYVHEQPWNAVGASAAIGLLLGYLLARRN
jgi:ElaB/YqjD/DUF883 family membrane-anchored ribosome-binding protein